MEALYSKLYDKYTKLKAQKGSALDKLNQDQEEKFMSYVKAADELIQHLTSENDTLRAQASDLRHEVASIRSTKDDQQVEYQKLLMEESQKNKELSEEIERLHRKELLSSSRDDISENVQVSEGSPLQSNRNNTSVSRKRGRDSSHKKEVVVALHAGGQHEHTPAGESDHALPKETMSPDDSFNIHQREHYCQRLGSSANANDPSICIFQELVESLVGLKFSIVTQTDDIVLTAVHESSGYSFSLRWVKNSTGEEELLYRVSSLGTFERVAPEWMRDLMFFSKSMCPIFFKRVSSALKLHH